MPSIAITGAAGFVGSHLMDVLARNGHAPAAVPGDLMGQLTPHHVDAVVHAASVHPGTPTYEMVLNNAVATGRMVDYAKKADAKTFVYLSSISVCGQITGQVVDENTPILNPDPYGMTKRLGELIVGESPIRSISIRCCGIIGRGSSRNWLSRVLESAKRGNEIAINNPQAQFNNAVYVGDICQFVSDVISNPNWSGHPIVTAGADGMTTVGQAVQTIVDATGGKSPIRVSKYLGQSFTVLSERAKALGYRPQEIIPMLKQFVADQL